MRTVYTVCLIVCGAYGVISVVGNGLLDGLDFDWDIDFDAFTLPIKPFTIMVFATVFGGAGLIALNFMTPPMSLLPAIPSGMAVAALLHYLIYVKLKRYETQTASEADAVMTRAEVAERIPPGGYGKVSYVLDNNILSGAAREFKPGKGISKGAKVYILEVRDNVYYVSEDLDVNMYVEKGV